jgi:hypothetical protein
MLERAALARTFGRKQRELPAPRVRTDERERVGAIDYVHAQVAHGEVRNRVAIG